MFPVGKQCVAWQETMFEWQGIFGRGNIDEGSSIIANKG